MFALKRVPDILVEFAGEQRGAVAITFAAALVALIGFSGASIDGARALNARTSLQDAADAAALASVSALEADQNQQTQIARDVFAANLTLQKSGITSTPTVTVDGDTVNVSASATVETFMLGVINISDVAVAASATGKKPRDLGKACVLALDSSKDQALALDGGARLSATGCVVHSNSNSDTALSAGGTTNATADAHCAVGNYEGAGFVPTPYSRCMRVPDPFADLAGPDPAGCDYTNKRFTHGAHVATPGTYCGGITFLAHAEVTLSPGVYIIKDGSLRAHSNSTVTGDGVVFYLTGSGAFLDIKSGSNLTLTAPTAGLYAGFVFMQDRNSSVGETSKVAGGGSISIVGAFYLPTQTLDIGGGGDISATSPFMPIVANDIKIHGNANLSVKIDNSVAGMPDFLPTVWSGTPRLIN